MTERARVALSRAAAAALVIAPVLVITWAFRPGYMNADSLIEYSATKPWGDFTDWRAPLIEKLWDAFETAGVGSPTIVLFAQSLTMVVGFYLVMRAAVGRVASGVIAAVMVFSPLVLSQVMLVGRDTWLTCFVVLQLGCAIRWDATTGRARQAWLGLTILTGLLALATRQNAGVLEMFVLVAIVSRGYARRAPERGRLRALVVPVALGGAACVVAFGALMLLPRVIGARDLRPEAWLYAYDLTGMSLRDDEVLLGPESFPSQDLDVLRERWNPQRVESVIVPLGEGPVLLDERFPDAVDELSENWRTEIGERPGTYLAVRWELFARILGWSQPPTYVVHGGVDGPNPFGFAIANPDADDAFRDYLAIFSPDDDFAVGSDVFRPWIWLTVGLVAAAVLVVPRRLRARPGALEIGLAAVGAVAFECTYFLLAMGESFRYSYPAVVLSLLAAVFLGATLVAAWRERRSEAGATGEIDGVTIDGTAPAGDGAGVGAGVGVGADGEADTAAGAPEPRVDEPVAGHAPPTP